MQPNPHLFQLPVFQPSSVASSLLASGFTKEPALQEAGNNYCRIKNPGALILILRILQSFSSIE
jgi:hypothetical protein